jgi:hypothetical protein
MTTSSDRTAAAFAPARLAPEPPRRAQRVAVAPFTLTLIGCSARAGTGLALAGEVEAATAAFERATAAIKDVGLLAEEVDPAKAR